MFTGKEKIAAALSPQGTPEIPAVICYEGIYTRDHWEQLFDFPWWYSLIGGWSEAESLNPVHPHDLPLTFAAVERRIPPPEPFDPILYKQEGRGRLAQRLLERFGKAYYPYGFATGPQWGCYNLWGFEDWMMLVATQPELVRFASQRQLAWSLNEIREAAALGARGIWIEDCMVDMISRKAFAAINLPLIRAMVAEIRRLGMHSIYYFCGDPKEKLDLLLETEADALALEESKKGFTIDIAAVAAYIAGRCALLGNLDAIHLLPDASEEVLTEEIERQVQAGWLNWGRFVMSLGSPVTPGTTPERVRQYTDLTHALGRK
jgi:uroporphyrinogen-III decarboxylase